MDSILQNSLLYDFYGELLTEHQRRIYEQVVLEDLSLSEGAEIEGISRQGIHDLIRRCRVSMEEYESKLHLVEHFIMIQEQTDEMMKLLDKLDGTMPLSNDVRRGIVGKLRSLAGSIKNEL